MMNDTTKIALQDLFDAVEALDQVTMPSVWHRRLRRRKTVETLDMVVFNSMTLQDEINQELNEDASPWHKAMHEETHYGSESHTPPF